MATEITSSTPSDSQSLSKVRVILRVRPFLISSRNENPISCICSMGKESEFISDEVTVVLKDHETSRKECYKLDAFFGQEDNNVSKIFEKEVRPLIPGLFQGCNATVFAYGATGSGKTYTMQGTDQLPGLMPLAMSNILSMCNHTGSTVAVSYYEIYLDKCYDLLEPKEKEIMVWNDKDEKIHLMGLAQIEVNSMSKFHEIFSSALERRKVALTGLNDVSSRSHGVLVINISTPSHDNVERAVTGKLNLIDLAGNEDNRRTCNEGIRLQESAKINQSLFALSNVIYALNNSKPRIPYRESKLTRILQDSLGGTSRALMVACLNPGEYQESIYTVSLAARSRHVTNFVSSDQKSTNSKVKVDMEAKLRAWLDSKGKSKNAQRPGLLHSPFTGRTPTSITSGRKLEPSSCEIKAVRHHPKQRTPGTMVRNLFNGRDRADPNQEAECFSTGDTIKKTFDGKVGDASELQNSQTESVTENEEAARSKPLNTICSTPVKENTSQLQSPQRKVLSPINSNTPVHITPKFHSLSCSEENSSEMLGTPLDKFTAHSSSLKSSFVQDYIALLNTASREELLELKGIGQKMAEYIIDLRETSPLKTLNDLEKIGLSSKQVHNMFGRAARGVFEKFA